MQHKWKLPYGKTFLELSMDEAKPVQVLEPSIPVPDRSQEEIIKKALDDPISSPTLKELTKEVKKIVIITNDNTRPMPSKITIPMIIASFFYPETYYDITILIACGLHRKMTREEMVEQYGEEICRKYKIVNHEAKDEAQLAYLGKLSTGNEMWVNRLVADADLVISEGFIESHFCVGFSGGRKSILPGVSGWKTIMYNHRPENIASPYAIGANLEHNPMHLECMEAAKTAKLAFILNVALNKEKKIIEAFAGDPFEAHARGCAYVKEQMKMPVHQTDIVITTNSGYPLDRNPYQTVKGIDTAAVVAKKGGSIIVAAECRDGVGHAAFSSLMQSCGTQEELFRKMSVSPSMIDKWQAQILARTLVRNKVILVSEGVDKETAENMFLYHADTMEEALKLAFEMQGEDASVSIMPEGPVVIPVVEQQ